MLKSGEIGDAVVAAAQGVQLGQLSYLDVEAVPTVPIVPKNVPVDTIIELKVWNICLGEIFVIDVDSTGYVNGSVQASAGEAGRPRPR